MPVIRPMTSSSRASACSWVSFSFVTSLSSWDLVTSRDFSRAVVDELLLDVLDDDRDVGAAMTWAISPPHRAAAEHGGLEDEHGRGSSGVGWPGRVLGLAEMLSPQMTGVERGAVRRATPGDAPQVARLLYDFQVEYDEPTPDVETLGERPGERIRNQEIISSGDDGPDTRPARFRPWVTPRPSCLPRSSRGRARRGRPRLEGCSRQRSRPPGRTGANMELGPSVRQTSLRGDSRAPDSPTVREPRTGR